MPITAIASSFSAILTEKNSQNPSPNHVVHHPSFPFQNEFSAASVADFYRPPLHQTLMHGCICNHGDEGVQCTHLCRLGNDKTELIKYIR